MNCTFIVRFNFAYTLETTNLQFHQHNDHDVDKIRYGGKRTPLPDVISTDKLISTVWAQSPKWDILSHIKYSGLYRL